MMKEVFSNGAEITEIEHGVRENFKALNGDTYVFTISEGSC
jgi:hypothetical protein